MSASISPSVNRSALVKWSITFGVPILLLCLPVGQVYTQPTKYFLAITVWALLCSAFEIVDLYVPSVLLPILYIFAGVCDAVTAYSSWTNFIVFNVAGAMLFANILEEIGLLNRIAYWVIRKCGGTFTGSVWGLFIASCIISVITFGNGYVVVATLTYGICKALKVSRTKEASIVIMAGMLGGGTLKLCVYNPIVIGLIHASARTVVPDFYMPFQEVVLSSIPVLFFSILFLGGMLFFNKKSAEADNLSSKAFFDEEYKKLGKVSAKEKKTIVVTLLLMLYIFLQPLHGLEMMYGFIFFPCLLFLPGIDVGQPQHVKTIPFSTLLFIASCLTIGLVGQTLGIMQNVIQFVTAVMSSVSLPVALYGILTLGLAANFLLTPFAMLAILPGPVLDIALNLGISGKAAMYTMMYSTDMVFLPYEYVIYLIFFSFGTMKMSHFIKYQSLKVLCFYIFFGLVFIPFWKLLGIL